MTAPIPGFSADHEAPESFPTVTTFSATSTWATPGNLSNRSARGEPAANSLAWKKKGPPGCTVRLTVNLHVSGSATEISVRIVIVASTGRASDIFDDLGRVALSEGPQVLERVAPGTMAYPRHESKPDTGDDIGSSTRGCSRCERPSTTVYLRPPGSQL